MTNRHIALLARCVAILALALIAASAPAADVQFNWGQRQTWVGSPVVLSIVVSDGGDVAEPILPKVEGIDLAVQPGRQTMSSMQFINGKVSNQSTTTLTVLATPLKVGTFTLPPISITVDGIVHTSKAITLSSAISETGDLLKVAVVGEPASVWVGEPMKIILRIMVKPFSSSQHRVVLGEDDMWQFIDGQRSNFGPFSQSMAELQQRGQRPVGREELIDGISYWVYELTAGYTPNSPGDPNFSDVRISWNYPTRLSENRGFFGRAELSVSGSKPITAVAKTTGLDVMALPEAGRPDSFHGAIGEFALSATAKPMRVGVGDPITLSLVVTDLGGGAALSQLQPPALDSTELQRDFRMPTAPLAGTIAGATKTFTQTLRPVRAGIDQIPPIEFAWFDPRAGQYRTAVTKPIEIVVVPSERISTESILGSTGTPTPASEDVVAASGGIVANMAVTHESIRGSSLVLGKVGTALALVLPPVICGGVLVIQRRKDRLRGDVAFARRASARSTARSRLKSGESVAALTGFIADHANRTSGTLTRHEVRKLIERAGGTAELVEEIDALLRNAERSQFAATAAAADCDPAAVQRAIAALGTLDWVKACKEEMP